MNRGWTSEDTFNFFVPAQIISKSGDKGKEEKRWIQGIASTNARDLHGEIVNQNGIDFSYFLERGYFNDDHNPGPENRVGEPVECKLTKNGLWVKGFLYKSSDPKNPGRADHYWKLMNDLAVSGSSRKVGFSIQGKVTRREGNKIEKCWIQDIAITTQPVNTTTWAEIAKSLSAMSSDLVKDEKEEAEKAMTAANSPVVVESLDSTPKNVVTPAPVNKSLSFIEACEFVKSNLNIADEESVKSIVNVAFGLFGKET